MIDYVEYLLDALMCAELEQRVQAVDMLLDKIEKGTQGYVHQILMPSLVQRGTCRSLT